MNELRQRKVNELSSAEPTGAGGSVAPWGASTAAEPPPLLRLRDVKEARGKLFRHVSGKFGRLAFKLRVLFSAPQAAIVPVSTLLSIYSVPLYEDLGARYVLSSASGLTLHVLWFAACA